MATTDVLQQVSLLLRQLLIDATSSLPAAQRINANDVSFESPVKFELGHTENTKLSIYLYHIEKNAHLNNEPLLRIGPKLQVRPFYVDLHYLITPVTNRPVDNLQLMGRVLQVFSSQSRLQATFLQLAQEPSTGEAWLRMLFHDLDAMNKLWGALSKPYRMSVAYEVSPVPIESVMPPSDGPPVVEAILDVQQVNGAP